MPKSHFCSVCKKEFKRKLSRDKHLFFRHGEDQHRKFPIPVKQNHYCPFCENIIENSKFKSRKELIDHIDLAHLDQLKYSLHKSAVNGKIKIFRTKIFSEKSMQDFATAKKNQTDIADVIRHELSKTPSVNVSLILSAAYRIPDLTSAADSTKNLVSSSQQFSLKMLKIIFQINHFFRIKGIKKKEETVQKIK